MGTGFSFERLNAADYEALRPHHAREAVAWVAEQAGLDGGSLVVDLASGTGQLSRLFALLSVRLVAVEPAWNMRAELAKRLPDLDSATERPRRSHSITAWPTRWWSATRFITSTSHGRSRRSVGSFT